MILLATIAMAGICATGCLGMYKDIRELLDDEADTVSNFQRLDLSGLKTKSSDSRLSFLVDAGRQIIAYSNQNMDFFEEPSKFMNKDIVEAVPLSKEDRLALLFGFAKAATEKIKVKVPYTLKDQKFVAKITPLIKGQSHNFFVNVKESE